MARAGSVKVRVEVEFTPKGHYCPCGWDCHLKPSPCSFSCVGHHEAWKAAQPGLSHK